MAALDHCKMNNCYVLLMKSLSPSKREESSKHWDLVRYLDRSIKIDFSGDQKDLGGGQFHV